MRYRYLIYIYIISLPLYLFPLVPVNPQPIRFDWVFMGGIIISYVYLVATGSESVRLRLNRPHLWLLLFLCFATVSFVRPLLAADPTRIGNFLTTWGQIVFNVAFVLVLCQHHFSTQRLASFIRLYVILGVAIGIFAIVQSILGNVFDLVFLFPFSWDNVLHPWYWGSTFGKPGYVQYLGLLRATSVFTEPRHLGAFLATPLLLLVADRVQTGSSVISDDTSSLAAIIVLVLGVLLSFSASAYIIVSVGFVVVLTLSFSDLTQLFGWMSAGGTAAASFILIGVVLDLPAITYTLGRIAPSMWEIRHLMDFSVNPSGPVNYLRGAYFAIEAAATSPLVGHGFNQGSVVIDAPMEVTILPPFLLLASLGLVGFGVFAVFLLITFGEIASFRTRSFQRDDPRYRLLTLALVFLTVVVIKSTFGSKYNYPNTWFWFDVGIALLIYTNVLRAVPASRQGSVEP